MPFQSVMAFCDIGVTSAPRSRPKLHYGDPIAQGVDALAGSSMRAGKSARRAHAGRDCILRPRSLDADGALHGPVWLVAVMRLLDTHRGRAAEKASHYWIHSHAIQAAAQASGIHQRLKVFQTATLPNGIKPQVQFSCQACWRLGGFVSYDTTFRSGRCGISDQNRALRF
jgi:hypothetical protein